MLIILCLYIVALWLVFSKFRLVKWGWLSGTISLLIGGFILATFLALFNYLTPSGRVTVTGRVVEVTPNVTGRRDWASRLDPGVDQLQYGVSLSESLAPDLIRGGYRIA
jgi:hypothetical protein